MIQNLECTGNFTNFTSGLTKDLRKYAHVLANDQISLLHATPLFFLLSTCVLLKRAQFLTIVHLNWLRNQTYGLSRMRRGTKTRQMLIQAIAFDSMSVQLNNGRFAIAVVYYQNILKKFVLGCFFSSACTGGCLYTLIFDPLISRHQLRIKVV